MDPDREAAGCRRRPCNRTKSQIAIDQLTAAVDRAVGYAWLAPTNCTADPTRSDCGVADLGIHYVVEVPSDLTGWLASRGTHTDRPGSLRGPEVPRLDAVTCLR